MHRLYVARPLPPPSAWGNTDDFEVFLPSGKRRCMDFSSNKLRMGLTGKDAQCSNAVYGGLSFCRIHRVPEGRRIVTGGRKLMAKAVNKKVRTMAVEPLKEVFTRYGRYLPKDLMDRVLHSGQDPHKLSLENELDIVTARIGELLERLDTHQSKEAWNQVSQAYNVLDLAIKGGDVDGIKQGMIMLKNALSKSDYLSWIDVVSMMQHRKTFVESERRRKLEQAEMLSIAELIAIMAEIQAAVFEVVIDTPTRLKLADRFRRLAGIKNPHGFDDIVNTQRLMPGELPRADFGCDVCRNEEFRERNVDSSGQFICPMCKAIWGGVSNAKETGSTDTVFERLKGLAESRKRSGFYGPEDG